MRGSNNLVQWDIIWKGKFSNSAIHKAAGSLVTDHSLQNGKMSMGNCRTERPPDPILYGGRPSGGFVNSAVKVKEMILRLRIVKENYCRNEFRW